MITEGILATVGLRILNEVSRKYNLKRFNEGIIEDEARHVNFGFSLIDDKEYAIKRIEELFPLAVRIVKDGKEKIEPLGYSLDELIGLMEELKNARIEKLSTMSK
jgi:ribonucleoside-diphosphate reductase beta chain